ncbi:MAG: GIY-YIG nuclease family protein [Nostoc sp.]|uniref:GIY-YIG nuclease family protein n=1 Tax=Nostoc sp. TaxID=1180 RepID=UPI002FF96BED
MKLNLNYKDMSVLSYIHRRELPSVPGIYYVGNYNCPVMYIGLSRNLKKRHINHHRQIQFESIDNPVIRYQILPKNLLAKISNLEAALIRLEKQSIDYYRPPLNYTRLPNQPIFRTSHGPIYIQIHKVREEGYCLHFDSQDEDELAINTSKLSLLTRAIEEQRPIFLIASGYYENYEMANYPNLSKLTSYSNDRIYLLVSRFVPYEKEQSDCPDYNYVVYGATSKVFINPYIILNNRPGFDEFRGSYLKLGFTNCERSPFVKELLRLGEFNLL